MKQKIVNMGTIVGVLFVLAVIISDTQAIGQTSPRLPGDAIYEIRLVDRRVSPNSITIDVRYSYNYQRGQEVYMFAVPLWNGQYISIPGSYILPIKVPLNRGVARLVAETPNNHPLDGVEINLHQPNYHSFIKEKYQMHIRSGGGDGGGGGKGDAPTAPSTSPSPEIVFVPILR